MLSKDQLDILLDASESAILDFKKEMYAFDKDPELRKTAAFVKDIICMINTIRAETAYIIIGVDNVLRTDSRRIGLPKSYDDAEFQSKVKDKIFPRPVFSYYELSLEDTRFGIFEFPIFKYEFPVTPTIKMRGLDVGRVYYRHSTCNTEATGMETIRIQGWLQNLPSIAASHDMQLEISRCLTELTSKREPLSSVFVKLLSVGKKYSLPAITEFCSLELTGFDEMNQEKGKHRLIQALITSADVEITPSIQGTVTRVKKEMMDSGKFEKYTFLFNWPISRIEEYLHRLADKPQSSLFNIKKPLTDFFPEEKENVTVTIFFFYDEISALYTNIRQHAIDLLIR